MTPYPPKLTKRGIPVSWRRQPIPLDPTVVAKYIGKVVEGTEEEIREIYRQVHRVPLQFAESSRVLPDGTVNGGNRPMYGLSMHPHDLRFANYAAMRNDPSVAPGYFRRGLRGESDTDGKYLPDPGPRIDPDEIPIPIIRHAVHPDLADSRFVYHVTRRERAIMLLAGYRSPELFLRHAIQAVMATQMERGLAAYRKAKIEMDTKLNRWERKKTKRRRGRRLKAAALSKLPGCVICEHEGLGHVVAPFMLLVDGERCNLCERHYREAKAGGLG